MVVSLAAVLMPLAVTIAVVTGLYGAPAIVPVIALAIGMVATVTFFVAVALAASTVVSNQAAVAAIGFATMFLRDRYGGHPVRHRAVPADVDAGLDGRPRDRRAGRDRHAGGVGRVPRALGLLAARRMESMEL